LPASFCRRDWPAVSEPHSIVLNAQRHLKWRRFDAIERFTMILGGICLAGFVTSVFLDVVTRTIGHPWLWLQEVTSTFFIYGIFIGCGTATRRADHLYLTALSESMHGRLRLVTEVFNRCVVLFAAFCMIYFGFINFLQGFGSFRMPSMTPIASLYAAIPLSGVLVALFTIEQLVNGWRHGFEGDPGKSGDQKHVMR
jgi:TRAP-type C4-dicarboxylate transport system permease small subunit